MSSETPLSIRPALPIVIAGHVDHGKSTLIGRLLQETGALPDGKLAAVEEMCRRRGMPFEWSFVTDALQAERDQGITIDAAQARFSWRDRTYVLVDAPGHKEFLKNMVTGAAAAEAAILVVDAVEGLSEQTRRHAYLLGLLDIRSVVVAVNKLDAVGYDQAAFERTRRDVMDYFAWLGIVPSAVVPISARVGDGLTGISPRLAWHTGPSLLGALDAIATAPPPLEGELRFPVQDVYKFDERRIIAGRLESGRLRIGDTLVFMPGERRAKVKTIEAWNAAATLSAAVGQSIGVTLDDDIFVERGQVAGHADKPPTQATRLAVRIFAFGMAPLRVGTELRLRLGTAEYPVTIDSIAGVFQLDRAACEAAAEVARHDIADLILASQSPIVVDQTVSALRRGVLTRDGAIAAACVVEQILPARPAKAANDRNVAAPRSLVEPSERRQSYGHSGGIVWLTGLSGAGKSTLATALDRTLFERGWRAVLLDADSLRAGLNADLGFSPAERSENVRRIGELARFLAGSGHLAIVACISPFRADRERLKAINGESFVEVFVKAGLETCWSRDPKGLYDKVKRGEIKEFTGVSSPYEEPLAPALVIDTDQFALAEAVQNLTAFVDKRFGPGEPTKVAS